MEWLIKDDGIKYVVEEINRDDCEYDCCVCNIVGVLLVRWVLVGMIWWIFEVLFGCCEIYSVWFYFWWFL